MHLIQQAFGEDCDLYEHVLVCPRDADQARLRKAYYRRALVFHPDKQQQSNSSGLTSEQAHLKFQAVSLAYQILQNTDARATYDETGEIPDLHDDDDADNADKPGVDQWMDYFDRIFGKVTASEIDSFSSKYKCSDEERRDVLSEFCKRKGSLVKMLDFVMLSEPRDAQRWVEDYLRPAMEPGGELAQEAAANRKWRDTMEKTLKQLQKQVEKENQKQQEEQAMESADDEEEEEVDDEETESEDDLPPVVRLSAKSKAKAAPKKAKPTQAKAKKPAPKKKSSKPKKKKKNDMSDLIAQIQNKNRGGGAGGLLSNLGARYGVAMDDDDNDPLDDEAFAKTQAKLVGKRKSR